MEDSQKIIKSAYNSYENFPLVQQNCIYKLVEEEDVLWKILKYNDPDAWQRDNLTKAEKLAMIYRGEGQQYNYNVFLDSSQDDVVDKEMSILRCVSYELDPVSRTYGQIIIAFEVYSHSQINTLSNMTTRVDVMIQRLIHVFNGAELEGFGTLYFNKEKNYKLSLYEYGIKPFKGKVILFGNNVLG